MAFGSNASRVELNFDLRIACMTALLGLLVPNVARGQEANELPLAPGRLFQHTLEGESTHAFALTAVAGDRLEVMAISYDFDLVLTLSDAAGSPLIQSDFTSQGGFELLTLQVEESQPFTLTVSSYQGEGDFQLSLLRCSPLPSDSRSMLRDWILRFPENGPMVAFAGVDKDGTQQTWLRGSAPAFTENSVDESTLIDGQELEGLVLLLGVLYLCDAREIPLHTPLRELAPELQGYSNDVLLSHVFSAQAGIRNLEVLFELDAAVDAAPPTRDQLRGLLARQQDTDFPPGSKKSYSNRESRKLILEVILDAQSDRGAWKYLTSVVFPAFGLKDAVYVSEVPPSASQQARFGAEGWQTVEESQSELPRLWISMRDWRELVSQVQVSSEKAQPWSWAAAHYEGKWALGYWISSDGQRRALLVNHYEDFPNSIHNQAFYFWNGSATWPLWNGPEQDVVGLGGGASEPIRARVAPEFAAILPGRYRSPELGFEIEIFTTETSTRVKWPSQLGSIPLYWNRKDESLYSSNSSARFRSITVEEADEHKAQTLRVHGWRYANLRFDRVTEDDTETDD